MWIVAFVLFLLMVAAGAGVAAVVALALGSLLSHIFAVTTFEATVVVLAAAGLWALQNAPASGDGASETDGEPPVIVFDSFPMPPRPQRRRKR